MSIADLRAKRAAALDALNAQRATAYGQLKTLGEKKDFSKATDQPEFDKLKKAVDEFDGKIKITGEEWDAEIARAQAVQDLERKTAAPVAGQDRPTVAAAVETDPYVSEEAAKSRGLGSAKGLVVGGCIKMIVRGGGSIHAARQEAKEAYGESHPVVKALVTSVGASGGFIVPPDYVNQIIELLRPRAVVRGSNPRTMPMPRGTMRLPSQTSAATASYGAEQKKIPVSQPGLGAIVASFKKLTALVPVSNDMMRYSDPAVDAWVRDDLVKVTALREDKAFLLGDGTQDAPRGFISFANGYATSSVGGSGVAGAWSETAQSVLATQGNFITANETYTLATVAAELGGAVNKLDTANVPDIRRVWFMHPRSWNYLNNVQNSLGVYVYRDELSKGNLLGYPFRKSTQIPIDFWDATSTDKDCSFIFLVEMDDALILDSMTLELAVSREGVYVDANGVTQSAFQNDETLIRAIMEHDFQMRHDASVAVIQNVRYAPAIS